MKSFVYTTLDMNEFSVFTDQQLEDLIVMPKVLRSREPAMGYKTQDRSERCDMKLSPEGSEVIEFEVFVSRNLKFIENFSIGLRYNTNLQNLGKITLLRYNGAHGETSHAEDGHYARPHIHRLTSKDVEFGIIHPTERDRKITDKYGTLEEALDVFFDDINITDFGKYFEVLMQRSLFQ